MDRRRSALRRWLTFGPSFIPDDWAKAAIANRKKYAGRPAPRGFGSGIVKVSKFGGPVAKGLFAHKTYTREGALVVRRKGTTLTIPRGRRSVKQQAASRRNLKAARAAKKGRRR